MAALALGFIEKSKRERRERHAVLSPFLHLDGGDRQHVAVDPVAAELRRLARAKHRHELKHEKDLHPLRRFAHDAHGVGQFLPSNRRHRRHDGCGENSGHHVHGVVRDEARADSEVEDLAAPHQHPLQRRLLSCLFERTDGVDEERRGDLVERSRPHEGHQVKLNHPPLRAIGRDPSALQPTPKPESVSEDESARKAQADFAPSSSGFLARLPKTHLRPSAERQVRDASARRETQHPTFDA